MKNGIKLIIIVCLIIFITGCEVNYNLEFKDNILEENIDIILSEEESTGENKEKMKYSLENEAFSISKQTVHEQYITNFKEEKNKFIGNLNYSYTVDNFADANLINQCYDSFSFVRVESGYSLVTSDIFKCVVFSYLPVDKYNITITTDYLVKEHNADIVDKNKYTWIIEANGDVQTKKPIKIVFSNETKGTQLKDKMRTNSSTILITILGGLFLIISVIYIIYYIKNRRNS